MAYKKGEENSLWRGGKVKVACEKCGKIQEKYPSEIKNKKTKFCFACSRGITFKGERNPRWAGGRIKNWSGYILVASPNHPFKDKHGYVREHRLVMEASIKRYLLPSEDIDHINGIKNDNRIENLQIISRSNHVKTEHKRGIYDNALSKFKGVKLSLEHRRKMSLSQTERWRRQKNDN